MFQPGAGFDRRLLTNSLLRHSLCLQLEQLRPIRLPEPVSETSAADCDLCAITDYLDKVWRRYCSVVAIITHNSMYDMSEDLKFYPWTFFSFLFFLGRQMLVVKALRFTHKLSFFFSFLFYQCTAFRAVAQWMPSTVFRRFGRWYEGLVSSVVSDFKLRMASYS